MATAVKRILSGSTDGQAILVADTTLSGTLLHTSVAGTTPGTYDEVWLWATNNDASVQQLNIAFGASGASDIFSVNLASKSGLIPLTPGLPLQNTTLVSACASAANVVTVHGFANQITD